MAGADLHRIEVVVRRTLMFGLGLTGLAYEFFIRDGDARTILLITDLVLIGLVPVEVLLSRPKTPQVSPHAPLTHPPLYDAENEPPL